MIPDPELYSPLMVAELLWVVVLKWAGRQKWVGSGTRVVGECKDSGLSKLIAVSYRAATRHHLLAGLNIVAIMDYCVILS